MTILDVVRGLYADDIVMDYRQHPDHIRLELPGGVWVAVGPDLDPEHPERDDLATGYIWTAYDMDGPFGYGGDPDIARLGADIISLGGDP